jgi:hypothetical protein
MAIMNKNVMVYIFSKKSMDLKNSAKPARPASTRITVSMVNDSFVWTGDAKRCACCGMATIAGREGIEGQSFTIE